MRNLIHDLSAGYGPSQHSAARDYLTFVLLPFDVPSATIYDRLLAQNLRVGTMDLRLAAIALSRNLTVLTRNLRDFGRVPALKIEDRTV
jgi:tRNA(fMet)-specific endonuclease VapC